MGSGLCVGYFILYRKFILLQTNQIVAIRNKFDIYVKYSFKNT